MQQLKSFFVSLMLVASLPALAQYTEVINSNRPGVSKAAFSVGTNVLQFELGGFTIKEEHNPLNYEVSGFGVDFAARFGLLWEQLEINIEGVYQNDTFTSNTSAIPFEDKRSNFRNFTIGGYHWW